jgi:outer membrane immunogenic protein
MLRIQTIGASLLALVAGAGVAAAADLQPTYTPPPTAAYSPAPAWSWTGPYLGLQGGYAWGGSSVTNNGWTGGPYAGYNFQTSNNIVIGIEGDLSLTNKSGTGTGAFTGITAGNRWNSTVRGRLGYAFDRFMVYGTGGLAVGGVSAKTTTTSESATKVGWVAGAGIEAALTDTITGRVEFRHTALGSETFPGAGSTLSYNSNDILVGIGMKF